MKNEELRMKNSFGIQQTAVTDSLLRGGCPPPITGEIGETGGGGWHEVTGW